MFSYYLKTAFRNLWRNKFYSTINIAGLSIGIAVSIMIVSFVWFERSFDRFHYKSDQIYRIIQSQRVFEKETVGGGTGSGLVLALKEEFPEIVHAGRLFYVDWNVEMKYGAGEFIEKQSELILADPEIFDIFDFHFIYGNPKTAFQDPNSIILTEEESKKNFGNENPMGEFITTRTPRDDEIKLKVTGVVKSMPENSHFHFKYLVPHEWFPWDFMYNNQFVQGGYTSYMVLPKDFNPDILAAKFPNFVKKHFTSEIEEWVKMTYEEWTKTGGYWKLDLQPLKEIHLGNYSFKEPHYIIENQGNLFRVQMYSIIALFIILLASINYIILVIAKSGIRAKEVGIHKVIGATRKQLIFKFLIDSIVLSFMALLVAITLINLFGKSFNKLLEIQTSYEYSEIAFVLITLFMVVLIIGALAGSYPAFLLSAIRPVHALKGQFLDKIKGLKTRNSLVIFQFAISILLIISSITVYKQFAYMRNKNLGFDKKNIIIIKNLHRNLWSQGGEMSHEERQFRAVTIREEILKFPSVANASYLFYMPGKLAGGGYMNKTVHLKGITEKTSHVLNFEYIDNAYLDVFGLELASGKSFGEISTTLNAREGAIINEAASNQLGLKDPIGEYIYADVWDVVIKDDGTQGMAQREKQLPIIGVYRDFHNRPLYEDIKPTIYFPLHIGSMLAIKFQHGFMPSDLSFLEKTWSKFTPEPLEYFFFDKEFGDMYIKEEKLAQAFTFFTLLAISIACLGIFGLATLMAARRTKEIGVRKVNGATINGVILMLNKNFVNRVLLAIIIACPIGYYFMQRWLENFAYKTTLNWWIFVLAGGFTLVIALLTVSWQSWKAATRNPVEALRDE